MSYSIDDEQLEVPDLWYPVSSNVQSRINTKLMAKKWRQRVNQLQHARAAVKKSVQYGVDDIEDGVLPASTKTSSSVQTDVTTGLILFRDIHKKDLEGQPYMCVSANSEMREIGNILEHDWKTTVPTIVLSVVSGFAQNFSRHMQRQWENLQEGFVNAANKTNMWIVTHGLNIGMTKVMGNVIKEEMARRQTLTCHRHPKQSASNKLPKLTLMGIVQQSFLRYNNYLDGKSFVTEVSTEGNDPQNEKYELNPHHTHFILMKETSDDGRTIAKFLVNFAQYLKYPAEMEAGDNDDDSNQPSNSDNIESTPRSDLADAKVPTIALLVGGGYQSSIIVAEYLKNNIPVVVIKGSGGTADLLSFAYEEIKGKTRGSWDPDYVETFILSELSKKIAIYFEKYRDNNLIRNKFREKILECVQFSHKGERIFLEFLDIRNSNCDLSLLNEHLLQAMFNTERGSRADSRWYYNTQQDVLLALDWNCPHICQSEIFKDDLQKYKINYKIFENALVRQGREAFVDLFLEQGFQVHLYLTQRKFCRLFERAENQDFFRTITLQGVFGLTPASHLDDNTLIRDLNWLIFHMTKIKMFINLPELAMTFGEGFAIDQHAYVLERRAQNALIIWAVVINRPKLARVFWRRADYPIHLAILISMLYEKLASSAYEKHIVKDLEDLSREFAGMAIGVLDASFQTGNCRAFDVLSEEVSDFDYKTAVEMAAMAHIRRFIAHPCCQKWLTCLFYGDIRTRDLKFGLITFPTWLKIILSAFLLLPMNLWIVFQRKTSHGDPLLYEYEALTFDKDSELNSLSNSALNRRCTIEGVPPAVHLNLVRVHKEKSSQSHHSQQAGNHTNLFENDVPKLPFYKKISTLWNAPVTKFWTHQIFYVLYLTLFSLTVLWPSCGNFYLDIALWFWTLFILLEVIYVTFIQYMKYSSIRLASGLFEIVLISAFLITFMLVRILPREEVYYSIFSGSHMPSIGVESYGARVIMCLGLLYFFYRFIWIYFPISPTLGRLLYRIRLMVVQDFMHFLRLALLFIVSGGIAIHSVIYPDYPMSMELIRRVFHRAWFTLFFSPIHDLEADPQCYVNATHYDVCQLSPYSAPTCPVTGFWPYVMVIQYFIILKLILITLLFALFSDTASKLAADAEAIWRYQRYHLVLDFQVRPRLPAPINVFSFLILFCKCMRKCSRCKCDFFRRKKEVARYTYSGGNFFEDSREDYYWRGLATDYLSKVQEAEKQSDLSKKQTDRMISITELLEFHSADMQNINVRINELEKLMLTSRISLEEIKHVLNKDEKFSVTKMHLLARQSPYIGTRINRYPLADRYVPWDVQYSIYDPVVYTKPKNKYDARMQPFVDEDLLQMQENGVRPSKPPDFKWNLPYTSAAGVTIDRTSWMTYDDDKSVIYKLDSNGLPMNPMGRTGLRGRGSLCRWGPNHAIFTVITRWRNVDSFLQVVAAGQYDDNKILEILLARNAEETVFSLPGGFEDGESKPYNAVKKMLAPDEPKNWNADDMYSFFTEFAKALPIEESDAELSTHRFAMEGDILFRGYIDDSRNTDNAWVEAEVWYFHYTSEKSLDVPFRELRWKKYSQNTLAKMVASHAEIVREVHQKLESVY